MDDHPTLDHFRQKIKSMPLPMLRKMVRAYIGAVHYAKTPTMKKLFADLAAIGKAELDRNKWSV